ncbi:hypothetical protein [Erythrobacter ani]|uniref:Uncharacterized protein n=1 Tax=Erythrobacter ani TaxID=2827235 RepID=A0ABS6SP09_9SPHN|nr:hypothetical protein [Erythrobacter ani]MBV7266764.1 hypothetical protein [Erythrobacter ani]
MPKTSHLPPISPEPHRHINRDAFDHQREWQRHVDAGRIGGGPSTSPEIRIQHARNEMILLGYRVLPNWDGEGDAASTRYY